MNSVPNLRQQFLRHNAQTSPFPLLLEFTAARGCYLYTASGEACLDLISGIGVSNLGHGNAAVIEAIKSQADSYLHQMVYGEFVQAPQVEFAKVLSEALPAKLDCVYFVNSGTEATEGAIKLARRVTGRQQLFAFENSYHGSTTGSLSLMGNEEYKAAFRPLLPGTSFLRLNNFQDLERITDATAAVFLETIQGEAGIRIPDKKFMQALRSRCTETGALLVLDEIQCAFGRTGKMFAFEHFDLVPDVLLLAKSLGGGMPLGAFISSSEAMNTLTAHPVLGHITTFGGHPVSCAAGLAAFKQLIVKDLVKDVEEKSRLFESLLVHPLILDVRRKGLMIALEFENFETNKAIIDACIARGVLVDWFLHDARSMRICPPLIIDTAQIRSACQIIGEVLAEWYGSCQKHSN